MTATKAIAVPASPRDEQVVDAENPWPGLEAFTEGQQGFFHGRDDEAEELLRRVERNPLTVLFGQSGLGKTSLLQAALSPALRERGFLPVLIRIDYSGSAPPSGQITAAVREALAGVGGVDTPPLEPGASLWEYLHRRDMSLTDGAGGALKVVLVFDQFEELFTLGQTDGASRARSSELVRELGDLIENRPSAQLKRLCETNPERAQSLSFRRHDYGVLLSLREDYLAQLLALRSEIPSIVLNGMRLARMNGSQALDAVIEPGRALVREEVARDIVRFVAGAARASGNGSAPSETGDLASLEVEPSILSLVCRELNNRRISEHLPQISPELVTMSRTEILSEFYNRCLEHQQPSVRAFVEEELLTDSGFRESMALERAHKILGSRGAPSEALNQLVHGRLLHVEERLGVKRIELSHDVLTEVVRKSRDERHQREQALAAEQREREAAAAMQRREEELAAAARRREEEAAAAARRREEEAAAAAKQREEKLAEKARRTRRIALVGIALVAGVALVLGQQKRSADRQNGLVADYLFNAWSVLDSIGRNSLTFHQTYDNWLTATRDFIAKWHDAAPNSASAVQLNALMAATEASGKEQMARNARDTAEAVAKADSALAIAQMLLRWEEPKFIRSAALTARTTAATLGKLHGPRALAAADSGIAWARRIDRGANPTVSALLASLYGTRGEVQIAGQTSSDSQAAMDSYRQQVRLLNRLPRPLSERTLEDFAWALSRLAWLEGWRRQCGAADSSFQSALQVHDSIEFRLGSTTNAHPNDLTDAAATRATTHIDRAQIAVGCDNIPLADTSYQASRDLLQPLAGSNNWWYKKLYGLTLLRLADLRIYGVRSVGDLMAPLTLVDTAIAHLSAARGLTDNADDRGAVLSLLERAYERQGQVRRGLGRSQEAARSVVWADSIDLERLDNVRADTATLADIYEELASKRLDRSDHLTGLAWYRVAAELRWRLYNRNPNNLAARARLAAALGNLSYAEALNQQGDSALAHGLAGIELDSTQTFVWTNIVHGYWLKGDEGHARQILLQRACQKVMNANLARATVLDFDQFRRSKISPPLMMRLEALAESLAKSCE